MKTWSEMSDEEQGALLLAHHRGEVIERYCGPAGWFDDYTPDFYDWHQYRIKAKETTYGIDQWCKPHNVSDGSVSMLFGPIDGATKGRSVVTYVDGKPVKYIWKADQ